MLTVFLYYMDIIELKNYLIYTFVFISFIILFDFFYKNFKKKWRIHKAKKILKLIRKINGDYKEQKIITYLRKIDPFVFEEMILTCLKERGLKIKRNKRYTGDGGLDGQFWIKRKRSLIQAKRYGKYIKKSDMLDFIELCKKEKTKGLFVHTGKTGKETLKLAMENNISILSGSKLIRFFLLEEITLFNEKIR